MQCLKFITHSILLFTVPSLAVHPQSAIPDIQASHVSSHELNIKIDPKNEAFSYDDVLDLLEEIEDGHIDERCTPEELEGINRFIGMLAKQGILPGDLRSEYLIQRDYESLLSSITFWSISDGLDGGNVIHPAIYYGQANGVLCKSWFKKQWDRTRHFVKEHKKAILIGAAVVVAVVATVGIVAVVASAGTAATVAAGATAGALSSVSSPSNPKTHSERSNISSVRPEAETNVIEPVVIPKPEVLPVREIIEEKVNVFKEQVAMEFLAIPEPIPDRSSNAFVERAREFGAGLAHMAFEGAVELVSVVPQFLNEIRDVSERFIPGPLRNVQLSEEYNPLGNFKSAVATGHKAIDEFFGIQQPQDKDKEIFSIDWSEVSYGVLPPPGLVGPAVACEGRVAMTQVSSARGWTVGQPIQNRTFWGGVPKWSTVRSRYWKNQAEWAKSNANHGYEDFNIPRMERGLAPQRFNKDTGMIESMELHHVPSQREGGLFDFIEVWPDEHAELDKLRRLGK